MAWQQLENRIYDIMNTGDNLMSNENKVDQILIVVKEFTVLKKGE